ncbi:MAG: 6-phosphogluconolactonase [Bacteroidales bacterium]|nr:6-phosphogluconolactonase [Bacteroidales bacterium]
MSNPVVKIAASPEETAHEMAVFLAAEINSSPDKYFIALSGGSTPKILYKILAQEFKNSVEWHKAHFFVGDDRLVPVSSSESNYGEAKRLLFDNISVPLENIHPVDGLIPPEIEAERYSEKINELVPMEHGLPCFDLMLLGLGEDGHTASIFPNRLDLLSSDKNYGPAWHPETNQPRVTVTGKVINNSRKIIFLVTGRSKSKIVDEILNKKGDFLKYPAAHIEPMTGQVFWFLDNSAAKKIRKD